MPDNTFKNSYEILDELGKKSNLMNTIVSEMRSKDNKIKDLEEMVAELTEALALTQGGNE